MPDNVSTNGDRRESRRTEEEGEEKDQRGEEGRDWLVRWNPFDAFIPYCVGGALTGTKGIPLADAISSSFSSSILRFPFPPLDRDPPLPP